MIKKKILATILAFTLVFVSGCSKQESDAINNYETEIETEIELENSLKTEPIVTETTVTSQFELDLALVNDYETIILDIDGYDYIIIQEGNYDVNLIIDAPEIDLENYGTFKSVTIINDTKENNENNIDEITSSETDISYKNVWLEYNSNNILSVAGTTDAYIMNPEGYALKAIVSKENTCVTFDIKGVFESLNIDATSIVTTYLRAFTDSGMNAAYINTPKAEFTMRAEDPYMYEQIPIYVSDTSKDTKIVTNVPVIIYTDTKISVTFEPGAEGSMVITVDGIEVDVTNISKGNITVNDKTIKTDAKEDVAITPIIKDPINTRPTTKPGSSSNTEAESKPGSNSNSGAITIVPSKPVDPTKPHTHNYETLVSDTATCETSGIKTYSCSCGAAKTEVSAKTGHDFNKNNCKTCGLSCSHKNTTVTNKTETDGNGFQSHYVKCSLCSSEILERCTFNSNKVCSKCNNACKHSNIATTSKDDNTHNKVCTICGYETPSSHNYAISGSNDSTHSYACADCLHTKNELHNYANGSCSACNYTCSHFGVTFAGISMTEHSGTCNNCSVIISKLHDWEVVTEYCSTCMYRCDHSGYEIVIDDSGIIPIIRCTNCGYEYAGF